MKLSNGCLVLLVLSLLSSPLQADGPADNNPAKVRRVPRLGIEVPADVRKVLESKLAALESELTTLRARESAWVQDLLPDVEIFHRAVAVALKHREFFAKGDLGAASRVLDVGLKRARDLQAGNAPWTTKTGQVVRGFRSRIDSSVQPYGLVVPTDYQRDGKDRYRLDFWLHGRGETLSEVKFIEQHRAKGRRGPRATVFTLHPYGRYSNAFKFAGEVDVLEAWEHAKRHYRIDNNRVAIRGFSMGGAGCWQFAVHYADRWFAATPGAGFSETPEFLKFFQKETLNPTWYQRKLWRMYDCNDYALNLTHCPTIAYSGEVDIQKQAADIMETALARHNIQLLHLIGPQTGHRIHPDARKEIERRLSLLEEQGRERMPRKVRLVTYTLKYNRMHWVTVDRLTEHWERAEVTGVLGDNSVSLNTRGVEQLTINMNPGECPFDAAKRIHVRVDGQSISAGIPRLASDKSWTCRLLRINGQWQRGVSSDKLAKAHNLQGPIDDAFMDRFIIVRPTGTAFHPQVGKWTQAEMQHAIVHWRRQFRGDAIVKSDKQITAQDVATANLVLFGDPQSNSVLGQIAGDLPIQWTKEQILVGDHKFDAKKSAVISIYPNPKNPRRYVVLNSGFTYREYDYLNNARQVSKLPDWAIVDVTTPVTSQGPGKILDADFFNERWQVRRSRRR